MMIFSAAHCYIDPQFGTWYTSSIPSGQFSQLEILGLISQIPVKQNEFVKTFEGLISEKNQQYVKLKTD